MNIQRCIQQPSGQKKVHDPVVHPNPVVQCCAVVVLCTELGSTGAIAFCALLWDIALYCDVLSLASNFWISGMSRKSKACRTATKS